MNDFVVSFQDVKRQFGKVDAVNGVTFSVKQGSVFGLLGTNGAGKTTAIRMLVGHLTADSGSIQVLGSDPRLHAAETLQRIAYVSDQMQLPGGMPLSQVFALNEQFFSRWDHALALQLIDRFGINPSSRYRHLSLGQKRRAVLVQAVCQGAELLVLDEPFSGLDVKIRRQCLDLLLEAAVDRGQTIVVSSHLLNDVERIVDTVAILDEGRLVLTGELEQLKSDLRRVRIDRASEDGAVLQLLQRCQAEQIQVRQQASRGQTTELIFQGVNDDGVHRLMSDLNGDVVVEQLNLEEIFIELGAQVASPVEGDI